MLSFLALGQAIILRDGAPLDRFRSRKEAALLFYLAHTGEACPRDFIADLLWGAGTTRQALGNLRTALTRLRKQVGGELVVTRSELFLPPENREIDSADLLQTLARLESINTAADAVALQKTLNSYRGPFLETFNLPGASRFSDWAAVTREHIRRQVTAAYGRLGQYALAAGDTTFGCDAARRWIDLDPLDETAHTLLIRLLLEAGQTGEAMRQYNRCVDLLRAELGVAPSAEMTALIKSVRPKTAPLIHPPAVSRHNLPLPYDQFFGRRAVQQEIHARLDQPWCRVVTLTGQGGVGKTRLALTVARSRLNQYRDGVWLVDLTDLDPDDDDLAEAIAVEIATILDLRLTGATAPAEQLIRYLQHKQMLLALDNFERLLAGREIVAAIARQCENVQMLVTSREALRLRAEWAVPLTGLNYLPDNGGDTLSDAEQLFMARRAQERWGQLPDGETAAIRAICRMVEGLPLAIELAAALTRHATAETIAERLGDGFDALTSSLYDVPERHRSLGVVFGMSWETLPSPLRQLLAQLSVFRGGFTETAVRQITGAAPRQLAALCEKSLLTCQPERDRYALHPVIQAYAAAKRPADDPAPREHTRYYLALLARYAEPLQKDRPHHSVRALEPEMDNIRRAWQRELALLPAGGEAAANRLLVALTPLSVYYQLRGLAREGEAAMQAARQAAQTWGAAGWPLAARAGLERARFQIRLGQYRPAIQTIKTALKQAGQCGDRWAEGMGYVLWGEALWRLGEYETAVSRLARARDIAQAIDASLILGWSRHHTGIVHDIQGRYDAALAHLEKARAVWQRLGNAQALSGSLNSIGLVYYHQGDLTAAQHALEQALSLCSQIEDRYRQSMIVNNLSLILTEQEDYLGAQYYLQLGLELAAASGDLYGQGAIYANLGKNLSLMGEHAAADYLEKGIRISESIGDLATTVTSAIALADVKRKQGDAAQAQSLYEKALDIARQNDFPHTECAALIGMAELMGEIDREQAKQYSAKAVALAERIQNPHMLEQAKTVDCFVAGG